MIKGFIRRLVPGTLSNVTSEHPTLEEIVIVQEASARRHEGRRSRLRAGVPSICAAGDGYSSGEDGG
jgi:hypothetical protein